MRSCANKECENIPVKWQPVIRENMVQSLSWYTVHLPVSQSQIIWAMLSTWTV